MVGMEAEGLKYNLVLLPTYGGRVEEGLSEEEGAVRGGDAQQRGAEDLTPQLTLQIPVGDVALHRGRR